MRRTSADPSSADVALPSTITASSLIVAGTVARALCSRQIASGEKYPLHVLDALPAHFLLVLASDTSNGANDLGNVRRLVPLSSMRHWGHVGGIRFGNQHVERRVPDDFVIIMRERQNARKRQCEAKIQEFLRRFPVACEKM